MASSVKLKIRKSKPLFLGDEIRLHQEERTTEKVLERNLY
jgi:hypothetical protein